MKKLAQRASWQALQQHYQAIAKHSMQEWFSTNPARFAEFSLNFEDILFDFSKNRIDQTTITLLTALARDLKLTDHIQALFSGQPVNFTEQRPALHIALRDRKAPCLMVNNHNVMPAIHAVLEKMHKFTDEVRDGVWRGATGKTICDIVNIGIGGSHLGPQMVTQALTEYAHPDLHCYFISNIDGTQLNEVLQKIDPERTLFIISSKSFTTLETLSNANVIQHWLQEKLSLLDVSNHFIAVTAAPAQAKKIGIPEAQIFTLWDWVGGRYSVWSAIGLPIALLIGMEKFYEFLDGAHAVDHSFQQTEFVENIPVLMGLLGIWYINFFHCHQQAIVPYRYELNFLPDYIQQADMESNGKSVSTYHQTIEYATAPIIIGQQGCDSQHSFFQLLHQGPNFVPIDFILVAESAHFPEQQDALIASALSQAQALMCGKSYTEAMTELLSAGCSEEKAKQLALHKMIPGNRPSNTLFMKKLTPRSLGSLLAIYEHKIFVQGVIWEINSFDQWGVELGKQLLPSILTHLQTANKQANLDGSTTGLIQYYRQARNVS
jgi:glucose-6-phosphate isomerase